MVYCVLPSKPVQQLDKYCKEPKCEIIGYLDPQGFSAHEELVDPARRDGKVATIKLKAFTRFRA